MLLYPIAEGKIPYQSLSTLKSEVLLFHRIFQLKRSHGGIPQKEAILFCTTLTLRLKASFIPNFVRKITLIMLNSIFFFFFSDEIIENSIWYYDPKEEILNG